MVTEIFDASSYVFNVFSVPTALAASSVLLLGVLVLLRERLSQISRLFFFVTLTVTIWLFCLSWTYSSANPAVALWWAKASFLGVPFIAPATYHFTVGLLRIYHQYRRVVWGSWLLSALFAMVAIGTDILIIRVDLYWWGYYTRYGWLGALFILFFSCLLVASMAHYVTHLRDVPPGRQKKRIQGLMLAFGFGYTGIVDFIPTYGLPLYPFGYLSILAFVLLAARAIWVYRLVEITPAFAANEIMETMSDALLVLDRDGVVRVVNRAARELFGYSKSELTNKPVAEAITSERFGEKLTALVWDVSLQDYEMLYQNRRGDKRVLCVSASVARDDGGEPAAAICIVRDITEEKRAQEEIRQLNEHLELRVTERTAELEKANQELESEIAERKRAEAERARLLISEQAARAQAEEAVRAREVLLSVVSHDLRNPLSAIKSTARLIQKLLGSSDSARDPNVDAGLIRIEAASNKMNFLIDELLDFARVQAHQPLALYRRDIDLVEMARQVAATHQQHTERHKVTVKCDLVHLQGLWDPLRLERMLDNLVSNAIKYSPQGGEVSIEVSREGWQRPGAGDHRPAHVNHPYLPSPTPDTQSDCAVLIVRDQGLGIPTEDLPYVFDWFHRADNVSGRIHGTGIGLASARQIAEQHGGAITVESEEGAGAAFTVRLPLGEGLLHQE